MDVGRQNQKESWIPQTPSRHILPVIYTDRQGNQLDQASSSELKRLSGLGECCHPSSCNWEAARGAEKGSASSGDVETSRECSLGNRATWNIMSLDDPLLALADAASKEHSSPGTNPWIFGNYMQEPNWGKANAFSVETTSQFAPLTPDKARKVESKKVTERQNLCTYARRNQEFSENGITSRGLDASGLQTDKELQQLATNSSLAVVSPVLNENHNPDKRDSDVIDLNRTPQQKPRRKKHRPKVINEGKSKGSQKSANPKSAASTEKPTGKRKYVRKKALNKASTSSPAEANEEFNNPKRIEPAKTSCRRALNFDIQRQSPDGSSKCRPPFDLDSQPEAQASAAINQSKSTVFLGHGIEVMVETTQAGIAYDLTHTINQMLQKYISLPEKEAPSTSFPAQNSQRQDKQDGNLQDKEVDQETAHSVQENTVQITPISPNGSNCSTSTTLTEEGQASRSKRKHSEQPDTCSTNLTGIHYNSLHAYQTMPSLLFPKKKRTEKGQTSATSSTSSSVTAAKDIVMVENTCPRKDPEGDPFTSKVNCWISAFHRKGNGLPGTHVEERIDLVHELQTFGCTINQTTRSTKKRSRCPTKMRDLASLTRIPGCALHLTNPNRQVSMDCSGRQLGNSHRPNMSVEALLAEMNGTWTTKKRTKKRASLVNSGSYSINAAASHGKIVLYNKKKFSAKSLGAHPEEIWKQMFSVDSIVEQLKHLDINRENNEEQNALVHYNIGNDMRNALVLYKREGTIVPYDGSFGSIRKRRPRPKVDLDEETNRVWKLLMGNINSEGIDGTDEEKAKWWEEERTVFGGRTNSFIARMHLVQGDRRFSPWKGSVLDSVIGVFLTQNVSDHLSSSAFMSLAARFPLKSKNKPCYDERTSSVIEKPIVFIPDSDEGIRWNEMSNQSICDQSSMTIHDIELDEEQEVVNSSESFGSTTGIVTSETEPHTFGELMASRSTVEISMTGRVSYMVEERTQIIDAFSSQNSVISGQNSVDSPIAQASERKESRSENISEGEDLTDGSKLNNYNACTSFMELLQKVGSPMLHDAYSQGNGKMDNLNDHKRPLGVSMVASSNCYWHLTSNSPALKVNRFDMIPKETQYGDVTKNEKENSTKYPNALASQITHQNKLTLINQEASRSPTSNNRCINIQKDKHNGVQSTAMPVEDPKITDNSLVQMQNNYMQKIQYSENLSGEATHIAGSTSASDRQQKNPQKTTESEMIELGDSQSKELNEMNAATRKAKSRRVGNEIRDDVDWDALRKQAEANGKRERAGNTMDSLDWEAVRCADVNEIANTIKERGMNNMLAERIKNLLNRLVTEHGSIDLEWLRDIPPDKAKEYLLSIRGLGLKSVECVRLLTLHHLAFPVDTNVGRIAVRLGWVPLQPLPESLQLHLLELYPVLESIQKYLWPRLCKLEQRTLYELHYQMITFGKVFCTKSKPNCNACPMRGECRHFASAFASARLALPGPEEKSIVSANENQTGQNPAVKADQLPLPLPLLQATKQSEGSRQSEANRLAESKSRMVYEPIIEEPSSPEPVSTQVTENDMEDTFCEDPDEIPTIKLNIEEFTQNLQNYMQENMELQEAEMSKALVALTAEAASIPIPKLKNVSRLRTEHQVYELPDSHPLLQGLDKREPDDPCSYLLAIWTPGETANSIQPPESRCSSQECGKLCDEKTCFSCNNIREANSQIVRGTLLIPCRTAMKGSFPLNGTYFQVNEVFADHDSSLNPIDVPRAWIWNLPRRTVYFGTSIPTIFKGLTTEGIQHCFWRGFVCVRGFDQKTRAPRPLIARLHFPASKLTRTKKGGTGVQ